MAFTIILMAAWEGLNVSVASVQNYRSKHIQISFGTSMKSTTPVQFTSGTLVWTDSWITGSTVQLEGVFNFLSIPVGNKTVWRD